MYLGIDAPRSTMFGGVVSGDRPEALEAVLAPYVALASWLRPAPAIVATLDLDTVDDMSFALSPSGGGTCAIATAQLADGGYPPDTAAVLGADIAKLATLHQCLTGASIVAVRLDVVEGDGCRRFHADYVTLRMLCSYRGAGTQWCRVAAPETVHDLATGTVAVLKGRLAMEEPTILHRSPPMRLGGGRRLLLVLDPG